MKKLNKHILSALLALALFVTIIPVSTFASDSITIIYEGENVTSVEFGEHEKIVVTTNSAPDGSYQWQIQIPDTEQWVNIYGQTDCELELSKALVGSLMDDGSAYVRCAVASDGDETKYTKSLRVTVSEDMVINSDAVMEDTESLRESAEDNLDNTNIFVFEAIEIFAESIGILSLDAAEDSDEPDAGAETETNDISQEGDMVTVEVLFLRRTSDGGSTEVFSSYPAELHRGTPYNAEVPVLDYMGYEPTCSDAKIETVNGNKVIQLNYPAVTQNITVTVWYEPVEVNFSVRYHVQNVYDDLYVEHSFATGQATTGTYPADKIEKDIPGFTKLYNQPEVVAANGNTEFQLYYDRNYYLYIFDPNGGHGVEPVYARHGTYISVPEPVKTGWEFAGWDLGVASYDTTTKKVTYNFDGVKEASIDTHVQITELTLDDAARVVYNKTYKALWTAETGTTYTLAYWLLGDNNQRTFLGSRTETGTSGKPVSGADDMIIRDGNGNPTTTIPLCGKGGDANHNHDAQKCYLSATDLRYIDYVGCDTGVEINGDGSTVLNIYYEYRKYTLKFYYAIESNSGTSITYKVIGGTSHPFGWEDTDLQRALGRYVTNGDYSGQCGTVDELPKLNPTGVARYGQNGPEGALSTDISYIEEGKEYTYKAYYDIVGSNMDKFYYISFTARYNDDISQLWPCNVFQTVTRKGETKPGWSSMEAVASGWNGQYRVVYTRENSNPTIKGVYERLDEKVLFQYNKFSGFEEYKKATEIGYVCFWENGAINDWSIPELYIYNIWIACNEYQIQGTTNLYGKDGALIGQLNGERELVDVDIQKGSGLKLRLESIGISTCINRTKLATTRQLPRKRVRAWWAIMIWIT